MIVNSFFFYCQFFFRALFMTSHEQEYRGHWKQTSTVNRLPHGYLASSYQSGKARGEAKNSIGPGAKNVAVLLIFGLPICSHIVQSAEHQSSANQLTHIQCCHRHGAAGPHIRHPGSHQTRPAGEEGPFPLDWRIMILLITKSISGNRLEFIPYVTMYQRHHFHGLGKLICVSSGEA